MNRFQRLRQCLRRRYGSIASALTFIMLITFFLEQNYVSGKRDLLYWRDMVVLTTHQPHLVLALIAMMICPLLTIMFIQQRLIRIVERTVKKMRRKNRRRQYADFIVRRLLLQLEMAMIRMPRKVRLDQQLNDPRARMRTEMAKEAAYRAVDIFRRDAAALLFKHQLRSFVLPEEELMLMHGGYGQIELRVDCHLLRRLLYPQPVSHRPKQTQGQIQGNDQPESGIGQHLAEAAHYVLAKIDQVLNGVGRWLSKQLE